MFKGLGNLGNIASMMGSFQKLPEKMQQLNDQMKVATVTGTASETDVTVLMNGLGHVQSVQIRGEYSSEVIEMSVLEATNEAGAAAKQLYADGISQMVADMDINIPGLDGILANLTGGG
ncbi:cytoplasmic protein [Rhodopirellula maiorica SM1]|uniref:Cytoplasmic protein n=1 Tax=Rhodopirellula maiorica SM1 TaxID=1265738 RepID=M5RM11_9BACT|nr:YbaB/EbfC family nucleoid-associated protein [Rhodopirellula maiorica]EMI20353.1 cytoplasmic protein [Rhodopirellula maiorica SM1]